MDNPKPAISDAAISGTAASNAAISGTAISGAAISGAADSAGSECCCHRTKVRSDQEYKDLMNRLSRIEGQIRGIRRMVEEGYYCTDILSQVAAANAALNSFNKVLLANHIRTCVAEDIREGREEKVDELVLVLQKLMK